MNTQTRIDPFAIAWTAALAVKLANNPVLRRDKALDRFLTFTDVRSVRYVCSLYNARFNMDHPNETFAAYKNGLRTPEGGIRKTAANAYPELEYILDYGLPGSNLLQSMTLVDMSGALACIQFASEHLSKYDLEECRTWADMFSGDMNTGYFYEKIDLLFSGTTRYSLSKRTLPLILCGAPASALHVLTTIISLHQYDRAWAIAKMYEEVWKNDLDTFDLADEFAHTKFVSPHVPLLLSLLATEHVVGALKQWNITPADILHICSIPELSATELQTLDREYPPTTDAEYRHFVQELGSIMQDESVNA